MFLIVAINAKQLPVAAIAGIVVMVMVNMVNGQLREVIAHKLTGTSPTYPGVEL
jgi:hypothetical protein